MDKKLFKQVIETIDEGYDLMQEYANKPHQYHNLMLYPVETHTLQMIGNNPGITASLISKMLNKTPSACSQILRKLEKKELILKAKNPENNREYKLYLTDISKVIYDLHEQRDDKILSRYYQNLTVLTNEEIQTYLKVQKALNKEFKQDLEESF
ncbi:MarR family transcriptional regulator [Thomasclavelia sp.]